MHMRMDMITKSDCMRIEQSIGIQEELAKLYPMLLSPQKRLYMSIKRLLDIIVAGGGLILLTPILIIVAIGIKCESPFERIFFCQKRIGHNGKCFKIIKFRSMKSNMPKNVATCNVKNPEKYMSCVGRFIRKNSIDELPQLWNVLKGDMSIVGPRPLIVEEEEIHALRMHYGIYQVLPGITGLAQVNGRDMLNIYEKVTLDWMYVSQFGFIQDMKVIWNTMKVILRQEGYQEGCIPKYMKEETNDTCICCGKQRDTG